MSRRGANSSGAARPDARAGDRGRVPRGTSSGGTSPGRADDARFWDEFLDAYLAAEGEAVLGRVGAYRLEGRGIHLFERIEGEHAAILGLPMLPLLAFLRSEMISRNDIIQYN